MTLTFKTILDAKPAEDTGERLRIVWAAQGGASYAHAYPVERVNERSHLCQGRYLDRLRDPGTPPGPFELPLYTSAQVKAFMRHQQRPDAVCACCYGVLYWLMGHAATRSVQLYRATLHAQQKGAGQ